MNADKRRWQNWLAILLIGGCFAHAQRESLLSKTENAYNPIPSPDGKRIAYVRTGWNREGGSGGTGRSNLRSEIALMDSSGTVLTVNPLADGFLSGWTPDGSALICYRGGEYWLTSLDGKRQKQGRVSGQSVERVTLAGDSPVWTGVAWPDRVPTITLQTPGEAIAQRIVKAGGKMLPIASPNGRYIAVVGPLPQYGRAAGGNLLIYDLQKKTWAEFGPVVIHPDANWDYVKPSWDPWFADSSHLVYATETALFVSTPDGSEKRMILKLDGPHGLPVPSPDGKVVAFATFQSRPMNVRPDLMFWGDSTIWVTPISPNSTAKTVTYRNPDTTYDLRWLDSRTLVFDRIGDVVKYSDFQNYRLWKAELPD